MGSLSNQDVAEKLTARRDELADRLSELKNRVRHRKRASAVLKQIFWHLDKVCVAVSKRCGRLWEDYYELKAEKEAGELGRVPGGFFKY